MDGVLGPKIGDAASLWNFTPSPGWTKEEVLALKLALEKFGIGRWVQIVDSGVLPGKLIQQLNGQTQRLLGQQSIAVFTGLHVDVDAVRKDNEAKQGPDVVRKSGLIINSGGVTDATTKELLRKENQAKYGLSKEHIDAIVLPAPVKSAHATATMERQAQAGGHRAKGKAAAAPTATKLKLSLMTSDVETLTAGQKLALLHRLHQRLQFLQRLARPAPASAGQPAPPAAKPAGGRKRKADGAAPGKKSAPELTGDPEQHKLAQLVAFGYPRDKCQDALEESGGNLERAVEWLCSNLS